MDAKSAIALAKNPMHHKRSKHIDIEYHWLREHTYENGTVNLEHCSTEYMVADMMTKALAFDLHARHAKNSTGYGEVYRRFFWCFSVDTEVVDTNSLDKDITIGR